jgi:hypothetical protein
MLALPRMKTRVSLLLGGLCALLVTVGCYHTVDDNRSKFSVVPFAKDRLESKYERSVAAIFAAAKEVLGNLGTLTSENTISKTLQAKVDNNIVRVRVDEVEPNVSRVFVQARTKSGSGNIDLAAEVQTQIALQLQASDAR